MRIDRHVYGSISGYKTLARSDGITASDARILEGLSIGQTSAPAFYQSLRTNPAYVVRSLGQRRTITRISLGAEDDQGRPTVQKVTLAVLRDDWDHILLGDIAPLLGRRELWEWNGDTVLPAFDVALAGNRSPALNGESARKLLSLLSLLEQSQLFGTPVILREPNLTLEEFRLLEMLVPPSARDRHVAVYRGLTTDLTASMICLAEQAPRADRIDSYRPGVSVETSPYARALASAGLAAGLMPLDFVQSYQGFAMRTTQAVSSSRTASRTATAASALPPQVVVERMPRSIFASLLALCVVLPIVTGVCTYVLMKRAQGRQLVSYVDAVTSIRPPACAPSERDNLRRVCRQMITALPIGSEQRHEFEQRLAAMDKTAEEMTDFEKKLGDADWSKVKLAELGSPPSADGNLVELLSSMERALPANAARAQQNASGTLTMLIREGRAALTMLRTPDGKTPRLPSMVSLCDTLCDVAKAMDRAAAKVGIKDQDSPTTKLLSELRGQAEASDSKLAAELDKLSRQAKGGEEGAFSPDVVREALRRRWSEDSIEYRLGNDLCDLASKVDYKKIAATGPARKEPPEGVGIVPALNDPGQRQKLLDKLKNYKERVGQLREPREADSKLSRAIDEAVFTIESGQLNDSALNTMQQALSEWSTPNRRYTLKAPSDWKDALNMLKGLPRHGAEVIFQKADGK